MSNFQLINSQEFFALVAPDGNIQLMTLGPDEATSRAIVRMLHKCRMGQSVHELTMKGYTFRRVEVTITPAVQTA